MGIDIYLNGYEEYNLRTAQEKAKFERAVKARDRQPKDSAAHEACQKEVSRYYDSMHSGRVGYLRSSYNGSGLFRVLEEIFVFDMGEYFFPGDWDQDPGVDVDGEEFIAQVKALERAAALALSRKNLTLPWINEYTEVTGEVAPDTHAAHAGAEAFGDSVFALVSQAGFGADSIVGGPRETVPMFTKDHVWYLTHGLMELREFGMLAKELNAKGEKTFAYISY
jgi:hypothetical protein